MAVSVSRTQSARPPGGEMRSVTRVTFDNSYTSGGEALTPANLGLRRVDHAISTVVKGTESIELLVGAAEYEIAKNLIHLLDLKTGKEVAAEKDMSKVVVQVTAYGKP